MSTITFLGEQGKAEIFQNTYYIKLNNKQE